MNGIDPQIHGGKPKDLMIGLRNVFRQPRDVTTVQEMLASFHAVEKKLPDTRSIQRALSTIGNMPKPA